MPDDTTELLRWLAVLGCGVLAAILIAAARATGGAW